MIRPAIASLAVAACLLGLTLAWEFSAFTLPPTVHALHPRVQAATSPAAAPDRTAEWVNTILARPLFSPDRRPTPVSVEANRAENSEGLPRLTAVLVGPFGRSAIFAADGSKPLVVTEGSKVNAWTVQSIAVETVTLRGPNGVLTLHPSLAPQHSVPANGPAPGQRVGFLQQG